MPISVTQRRTFPSSRPNEETHPRHRAMGDEGRDQPQLGIVPRLPQNNRPAMGAVPYPQQQMEDEAASAELRGMIPNVVDMAMDREGSRRLQMLIDVAGPVERGMVFQEVHPVALSLMQHLFGNHVIQRLLHYGTDAQKGALVAIVTENLIELSCNMFACRVVQKALELHGKPPLMLDLHSLFQGYVLPMAADQNGNHVLQCCLEMNPSAASFIFEELRGNIVSTSCLKYGCRVVQRLLSTLAGNATEYYELLTAVIDEVVSNLQYLVTDQFGNYVVQAVMSCNQPCGLKPVYLLRGSYPILCRHKHASNVVETAFCVAPPTLRNVLLSELCPYIVQLAGDPFGNFVVQRLYELSDMTQQASLATAIRRGATSLKLNLHGRSVLGMLQRLEGQQQQREQRDRERDAARQTEQQTPAVPPLAPLSQATSSGSQLPQSMYVPAQPPLLSMSMGSLCPATPVTPLTPTSTLSFTSCGDGWTHNPNYNISSFPQQPVEVEAPPTPQNTEPTVPEICGSPDNDLSEAYAYGY